MVEARFFFPSKLNSTNIVLTPKIDNSSSLKDLRPISLCNALYKIVSNVLANRLKSILPKCISKKLFAFVEGHSIIDNVLVAIEIIHHVKYKVRGKEEEFALKIDISKDYDKVDSRYLYGILLKMGFADKWISWMWNQLFFMSW